MAQSFPHKLPTPPSSRPSSSQRSRRCKALRATIEQVPQAHISTINIPHHNFNTPTTNDLNTQDNNPQQHGETKLKKYSLLPAIGASQLFAKNEASHFVNETTSTLSHERYQDPKIETVHNGTRMILDFSSDTTRILSHESHAEAVNISKTVDNDTRTVSHQHNDTLNDEQERTMYYDTKVVSDHSRATPLLYDGAKQNDTVELALRLLDGSRIQHTFHSCNTFKDILDYLSTVANMDGASYEFLIYDLPQQIISDLSLSLADANISTKTLLYVREVDPD